MARKLLWEVRSVNRHLPDALARPDLELLARIPAELAGADSERTLLARLTEVLGRVFPRARTVAVVGATRDGRKLTPPPGDARELVQRTALDQPQLVPPADGRGWLVSAPVLDGRTLVALLAVEAEPNQRYTAADQHALSMIAGNAALVAQRIRASEITAEQRHRERDLVLAREIQRRFLPRLEKVRAGVRVAAQYLPAHQVGGDFYDVVDGPASALTAVVGDVSGKGVPAALLMSRISSDFRRLVRTAGSLRALMAELNREMVEHSPDDVFATAILVRVDASRRRLTVANAGHVTPLVRRASGAVDSLAVPPGLPLGMMAGERYDEWSFQVGPGDLVLLMTDGVSEALDRDCDRLGHERLCEVLARAPADADAIHRAIVAAVDDARADDVTLLSLELAA